MTFIQGRRTSLRSVLAPGFHISRRWRSKRNTLAFDFIDSGLNETMSTYSRRKFLSQSVALAAMASAARNVFPSATPDDLRPLQFLVLGDSITWGQGLKNDSKFSTQVKEWLENTVGRTVEMKVKAHSGATILPQEESTGSCDGEVNLGRPTINTQRLNAAIEYRAASRDPRDIDLVLLNGGINDVGISTLVTPFSSKKRVIEKTNQSCYAAMKGLLSDTVETFCNARIVVTGYFPIISEDTEPDLLLKLILVVLGAPAFIQIMGTRVFNLVRRGINLQPGELGLIQRSMADVSSTWYRESTLSLQKAVKEINEKFPMTSAHGPCNATAGNAAASDDPRNRRVVYAHPEFKPEHSFGASQTRLWKLISQNGGLLASPIDRLATDDMLFSDRAELCRCESAGKTGHKFKVCERAATAHPNLEGAKEYARAVNHQLAAILPFTGWLKPQPQTLTETSAILAPPPATTSSAVAKPPLKGLDHPFFATAKNRPEVIAHRGGAGEWPAETKFACEEAVKVGVDVLELDVYLTKDKHLVLMHNETVDETTNGHGPIRNFTLAQLKKLDAGYRWTADGGKTFPYRNKKITIPTLKEIFEAFPQMRMNIEMKSSNRSPVRALSELIDEHKMTDRVLVASFSDSFLEEFRGLNPGVATSMSTPELLHFLATGSKQKADPPQREADALQLRERFTFIQLVNKTLLDKAHRLNLPVHAWTVNRAADMSRMIALGVDGIITDYPSRLLGLVGRI